MRCVRCGKCFDEEMYSGICPGCGHFHSRQAEYDVSKYFSAKFDDAGKTSTNAQAAQQHAQLHKMYDKYNMHQQRPAQAGSYPQGSAARQAEKAKLNGDVKEGNIVTPICAIIAILSILMTVFAVQMKKYGLTEAYNTLDYEEQTAGAGELFEINDRLFVVEKAEVIEDGDLADAAAGEKLAAVTVEMMPVDAWEVKDRDGMVYVRDGKSCKQNVEFYIISGLLEADDALTDYDYLRGGFPEGRTGKFYFFVDSDAEEITICFDQNRDEEGVSVLEKRVCVPLTLEEGS